MFNSIRGGNPRVGIARSRIAFGCSRMEAVRSGMAATSSCDDVLTIPLRERLVMARQSFDQRRRLPIFTLDSSAIVLDALKHLLQPEAVCIKHRPAEMAREPVAVHPHDVDVRRPYGDAGLEHLRADVDQLEHAALCDLLGI